MKNDKEHLFSPRPASRNDLEKRNSRPTLIFAVEVRNRRLPEPTPMSDAELVEKYRGMTNSLFSLTNDRVGNTYQSSSNKGLNKLTQVLSKTFEKLAETASRPKRTCLPD